MWLLDLYLRNAFVAIAFVRLHMFLLLDLFHSVDAFSGIDVVCMILASLYVTRSHPTMDSYWTTLGEVTSRPLPTLLSSSL